MATTDPSQPVRIMCPNLACRKVLAVPPTARGKTVRCKNCSTNIRVPAPHAAKPGTPGQSKPNAA
jgi:hypothetical protein